MTDPAFHEDPTPALSDWLVIASFWVADSWREYLCTFVQPANWDGYTIFPRPNPLMSAVMEEYHEIEAAKMRAENKKREAEAHDAK